MLRYSIEYYAKYATFLTEIGNSMLYYCTMVNALEKIDDIKMHRVRIRELLCDKC